MNKTELKGLINECFKEIKTKKVIKSLISECLTEMGRRRKEDSIPMTSRFQGKPIVYIKDLPGETIPQDEAAKELGYKAIFSLDAYVSPEMYTKLSALFSGDSVPVKRVEQFARQFITTTVNLPEPIDIANALAEYFFGVIRPSGEVYVKKPGYNPPSDQKPQIDTELPPETDDVPVAEMAGDVNVNQVLPTVAQSPREQQGNVRESKRNLLKKLIKESIEEIKNEEKKTLSSMIEELDKEAKKIDSEASVIEDDFGDYQINGCPPHHFRIRHQHDDVFDVTYTKDGSDRDKKLNVTLEDLKKFISEKVKSKDGNYTEKAFNKSAENSEDQVEKGDLPKHDIVKKKELGNTKKDDKDYIEKADEEVAKHEYPMKEVEKVKKQIDHPIKGEKASYEPPKEVNKKHVVKGSAANRRFKGLPKSNKKD